MKNTKRSNLKSLNGKISQMCGQSLMAIQNSFCRQNQFDAFQLFAFQTFTLSQLLCIINCCCDHRLLLLKLDTQPRSHLVVEDESNEACQGMFTVPTPSNVAPTPSNIAPHPLHVTSLVSCKRRPVDGATDLIV